MNRQRVQQMLDELARQARASNFSGYEAPVDSYEAAGYEAYLVSTGMDTYTAKVVAQKATQVPAMAAKIRAAMNQQGIGPMSPDQAPGNVLSAATFNFSVTRVTANIAEDLPFALFGPQDAQNGYRNIIGGVIPLGAGTVLTSVRYGENVGNPDDITFTYTNGANVDTVVVTCPTYPYPAFLQSVLGDKLRLSKMRMKLSNAALTRQFDLDLVSVANSPFGRGITNKVTPSTFLSPEQFQSGIVDLDTVFTLDKETTVAGRIVNTAAFAVNIPMFVEKFSRDIAKGF